MKFVNIFDILKIVVYMEEFKKEKFYEDMIEMFNIIKARHPNLYYKISENELNGLLNSYLTEKTIDSLDKSIYYLYKIFVRIGDSHTLLEDYYNPSKLKFSIIDGECIVRKTFGKDELIGAILESINGVSCDEIIKELKELIVPRTEDGINARIEQYLSNKAILYMLPSIYPSVDIEYTLIKDGKEYKHKENVFDVDYSNFQKPRNYEYKIVDNMVIINYRKCRDMEDYSFEEMVKEIESLENIDGYIVDLRGNEGGNSEVINPLIDFLKNKKVVTIVDKYVFSSGIMAYNNLRNIGSRIVGTKIAERVNNFGNILHGETKNYKIRFIYSTKYFAYKNNEFFSIEGQKEYDDFFSNSENTIYLEPIYFYPDIYAFLSKKDIIQGTDSVLEISYKMLRKKIEDGKRK